MRLAVELSKQESVRATADEEKQLQDALERSRLENHALRQLSTSHSSQLHGNGLKDKRKDLGIVDKMYTRKSGLLSDEEKLMRIATQRSAIETKQKTQPVLDSDNFQEHELPQNRKYRKRRIDSSSMGNENDGENSKHNKDETNDTVGGIESLSEEEQMKLALEMSLSEAPVEMSSKERNKSGVKDKTKLSEEEELLLAIEKSKVEHSPMKKMKIDGKLRYVDEDEMIRIAVERSELENTPEKHTSLVLHRGKVGCKPCFTEQNTQSKVVDTGQKVENIKIKEEVILIDSQSQNSQETDIGNSQETEVETNNALLAVANTLKVPQSRNEILDIRTDIMALTEEENDFRTENEDLIPPSPDKESSFQSMSQSFCLKSQNSSQSSVSKGEKSAESEKNDKFKISTSANKSRKFDLKANLFYDSDEESGSESEEDMFRSDSDIGISFGDNKQDISKCEKDSCFSYSEVKKEDVDSAFISSQFRSCRQLELNNSDKMSKDNNMKDSNKGQLEIKLNNNNKKVIVCTESKPDEKVVKTDKDDPIFVKQEPDYSDVDSVDMIDCVYEDFHDVEYQPNTQDLKDYESSEHSRESLIDSRDNANTSESDLVERVEKVTEDVSLPVISRPISRRYREMRKEYEEIYKQKLGENHRNDGANRNNQSSDMSDQVGIDMDEKLARLMQQEFDREAQKLVKERACIDDEYIARKMQESINKETGTVTDDISNISSGQEFHNSITAAVSPALNTCIGEQLHNFSGVASNGWSGVNFEDGMPEEAAVELQRREMEKIERWRNITEQDQRFAKQLEDLQHSNRSSADGGS